MNAKAKWICAPTQTESAVVAFCKDFKARGRVRRAVARATAMGVYALYLNGKRVSDCVLTPGWTSYYHRVQYQTYDVTDLLLQQNEIALEVGVGWAVGYIGHAHTNHIYADHTSARMELELTYEDGGRETVVTDKTWQVRTTQVTFSELYHGETVDLTVPIRTLGLAVEEKLSVRTVAQAGEWIKEQERLAPIALIVTPTGERVLDFGQNMAGYVEVRVRGKRGDRIVLHHAEVLDRDGNFYKENYRGARNENVFVLSGGEDVFKPVFSFQGFRYVRLSEYPFEQVELSDFCAVAVHSDMKRTGRFSCGSPKINQLYHNILWGQKSNYLDIPTDCPQRDERLGWTGDAQIFFRAAAFNYDVERFFKKWMGDVVLEQGEDGSVKGVIPNCLHGGSRVSAAWGDAATIIPWQLYVCYGNKALLKTHYPMMKKWVEYQRSAGREEYLWLDGHHYGDWLAMDNGPDELSGATPTSYIASAFYANSVALVIKAGEALGEDVSDYRALYKRVRDAIRKRFFVNGDLRLVGGKWREGDPEPSPAVQTQTAYVLALYFDLCEEEERPIFAERLADMIEQNRCRMTTGFVGTPYLLHALSQNGYTALAYRLLMQEENPSWLYSVCHGATTMWEHWNSLKEDGSFWSTSMNSFNHYAYGAVLDWLWGVAIGVIPSEREVGYGAIRLEPHPDPVLEHAEAELKTRHGDLRVRWYYKGNAVYYEFDIPKGCTAELLLPSGYRASLGGGNYCFAE